MENSLFSVIHITIHRGNRMGILSLSINKKKEEVNFLLC